MNAMRFVILAVAAIAAGAAVLLARGMLGGQTPPTQASVLPPAVTMAEIMVASKDIAPGHVLDTDSVRWQSWPKEAVSDAFIAKDKEPDLDKAVAGIVVRSPLASGQPISDASIVRAGAAGFLAATMQAGMRAVSIPVTAETSAGGFILPNDHVDVIMTRDVSGGNGNRDFRSQTILRNIRVLAVDQISHPAKDQQSAVAKTATLELMPSQAQTLAQSQASGILSLALRPLGDETNPIEPAPKVAAVTTLRAERPSVEIIRYGVVRNVLAIAGAGTGGTGVAPAPAGASPMPVNGANNAPGNNTNEGAADEGAGGIAAAAGIATKSIADGVSGAARGVSVTGNLPSLGLAR